MKPINILYYSVASFLPLYLILEPLNNINERNSLVVWLITIPLWCAAGMLSVPGKLVVDGQVGGKVKWVGLSVLFGIAECLMLIWMA